MSITQFEFSKLTKECWSPIARNPPEPQGSILFAFVHYFSDMRDCPLQIHGVSQWRYYQSETLNTIIQLKSILLLPVDSSTESRRVRLRAQRVSPDEMARKGTSAVGLKRMAEASRQGTIQLTYS